MAGTAADGSAPGNADDTGDTADTGNTADTADAADTADVIVGRIGRPHGLRGEVAVEIRTDVPERRFQRGAVLRSDAPGHDRLTVEGVRASSGRLLITFTELADRTAAEEVRGALLSIPFAELGPAGDDPDDEAWWDSELVGLRVVNVDGSAVGRVGEVLHPPGGDLLSVVVEDGREVLVPFVAELVPEVDVPAGQLVIDPPEGLLEL